MRFLRFFFLWFQEIDFFSNHFIASREHKRNSFFVVFTEPSQFVCLEKKREYGFARFSLIRQPKKRFSQTLLTQQINNKNDVFISSDFCIVAVSTHRTHEGSLLCHMFSFCGFLLMKVKRNENNSIFNHYNGLE